MGPLIPLAGLGLLAWLFASSRAGGSPTAAGAAEGDLLAEGSRWRQAAYGILPPTATLAAAILERAPWVRDGDWAASHGLLYYKV